MRRIRRLPEHDAVPPIKHRELPGDRFPSSTTARCIYCNRRIAHGFKGWYHIQDLSPDRFHRAKWHLATRFGQKRHFDIGDGKTACGVHTRRRVQPVGTGPEGQFTGGFSTSRCGKCALALTSDGS